jgi:hypothetical protein
LADSLWEGLRILPDKKLAIIWPNSVEMSSTDSNAFETAKAVLSDTSQLLADPNATLGNLKQLAVLLA